ncbi:polysaccharide export protein [Siculibacillus lacustris]|uniref:Polysaccharide export protein n=1 Tax=Siculibacillus lacustris TaxID=1549641 RepID=A0A4Q9VCJ5_9HYPH|nr:polysaccharide biosynthesis/export family protein [Siculibacillus lacustris]TBW32162.1 polysaccharide export protein [Siculibacillus lacustris]
MQNQSRIPNLVVDGVGSRVLGEHHASRSSNLRRSASLACLSVAVFLGGCDVLSRDGPATRSIDAGATETVRAPDAAALFQYVLMDVDQAAIANFGLPTASSLYTTFGNDRGPAPQILVGVGDILQITVFESQSGGLFIPLEAGSRAGNFVTMPPQTVDRKGTITVPYAGEIQAVGRSIPDLQKAIEKALASRAIEPQVVITLGTQSSSQVSVIGDVNTASKVNVGPAGDRVLDVLAKANGIIHPGYETYVTVQRGTRKATVYFDTILADARENIFVKPADTIYVYREAHSFLAFGAVRASGRIEFGSTQISFAEAVGKAAGLDDARADPRDVYLYRTVSRERMAKANVPLDKFPVGQKEIPVIFKANLRDPASYFAAQKFQLADKDVVYVSNSGAYELYKFLTLLNNTSDTIANVPSNLATARNAGKSLGQ